MGMTIMDSNEKPTFWFVSKDAENYTILKQSNTWKS